LEVSVIIMGFINILRNRFRNAVVTTQLEDRAMIGSASSRVLQPLRVVPDPLALWLRPGRVDHGGMLDMIASGDVACFGAVFDPVLSSIHAELREQILKQRLDAVLDPKTQPAATPGGYTPALGALPWGLQRPHTLSDFEGISRRRLIGALGDFVLDKGFTQVIAPTHVLAAGDDPWLAVDIASTRHLREYFDRKRGGTVPIIYSLAVSYAAFRNKAQRRLLVQAMRSVPMSELWLKVDGFGSAATPTAVRAYIEAANDFHELGVPVVADHVGGVAGLSLMAFGAVGGIGHGVTLGERFDAAAWRRPLSDGGFGAHHRVYVPAIDLMLKPKEAEALVCMSARTRGLFGCNDTRCCPRGVKDMLENPGRHFLYQRMKQITALGLMPKQLRPQRFLDQHVRSASDRAVTGATINWQNDDMGEIMAKKMQKNRKRLDALRVALGNHAEKNLPRSFVQLPKTRAAREAR
jgi:hypothetical protein